MCWKRFQFIKRVLRRGAAAQPFYTLAGRQRVRLHRAGLQWGQTDPLPASSCCWHTSAAQSPPDLAEMEPGNKTCEETTWDGWGELVLSDCSALACWGSTRDGIPQPGEQEEIWSSKAQRCPQPLVKQQSSSNSCVFLKLFHYYQPSPTAP